MSIREEIAKNIVTVLKEIEDPKPILVTREPFDVEKLAITQFPALLVQTGNEEKETISMGAPGVGFRQGTISFNIRGFVRGNELDTKRNDLIEAVEEALDSDRYRGYTDFKVIDSQVTLVEVINRLPPLAEIAVEFVVTYRYQRGSA
jgi:hypothetical protein